MERTGSFALSCEGKRRVDQRHRFLLLRSRGLAPFEGIQLCQERKDCAVAGSELPCLFGLCDRSLRRVEAEELHAPFVRLADGQRGKLLVAVEIAAFDFK